jgi:D-amino-acid oxidase
MLSHVLGHNLILGLDLSVLPFPLSATSNRSPHVLVVGGGVTGLITSWLLLDKGYRVTILSKAWATTSTEGRARYVVSWQSEDRFVR